MILLISIAGPLFGIVVPYLIFKSLVAPRYEKLKDISRKSYIKYWGFAFVFFWVAGVWARYASDLFAFLSSSNIDSSEAAESAYKILLHTVVIAPIFAALVLIVASLATEKNHDSA